MSQTGTLYKISYRTGQDGSLILRCLGRDTEGKRISREVTGARPYFYIDVGEIPLAKTIHEIVDIEPGYTLTDGREMARVYTRYPYDVYKIRTKFSVTGEADIIFSHRVRIDHGLSFVRFKDDSKTVRLRDIEPLGEPAAVKPRVLYLDIETDDSRGLEYVLSKQAPITAISVYDNYKNQYGCIYTGPPVDEEAVLANLPHALGGPLKLFNVKNEREILGSLGLLLARVDPDVAEAWNGSGFDFGYLAERAKNHFAKEPENEEIGLVYECFDEDARQSHGRFALVDPMAVRKKQELKQQANSLQAVGMEVLGFGKVERHESVSSLQRSNPARWVAYNIWDTHVMRLIDAKRNYTGYAAGITLQMGCELESLYFNSRIVDGALLQEAQRMMREGATRLCLPTGKDHNIPRGEAAEVFPPQIGLHEGVVAIDLAESYPSIMITFNISPETRRQNAAPDETYDLPTGGHYMMAPLGLEARALKRFKEIRAQAKRDVKSFPVGSPERERADTISTAVKFVVNSCAGVYDERHWRCASVETFEDITGMAKAQLRWNRDKIQDEAWLSEVVGFNAIGAVLMGDTDSVYFKIWTNSVQITDYDTLKIVAERVVAALNASYADFVGQYGATENYTQVDLEGIFERLRILPLKGGTRGAKKRYYGLWANYKGVDVRGLSFDARKKISGVEVKRFNIAPITKTIQLAVIERVLTGRQGEIRAYIDQVRNEVMAGKRDNELMIPAKLSDSENELQWNTAIEAFSQYVGVPVQSGEAFRWSFIRAVAWQGKVLPVSLFAIPYLDDIETMERIGLKMLIDRERMFAKTVKEPLSLIYPEYGGVQADLGARW